jgi:hypothetical protein
MIVVEGPDGAGKTTLVNRLHNDLDLPVNPKVVDSSMKAQVDLRDWINQDLSKGFRPLIFDRYPLISEAIYGPMTRHESRPGFDDFEWLRDKQTHLRIVHPIIIWCLPPIETVVSNVEFGDQPSKVVRNIRRVYWLYHFAAASWPKQHWAVWDYTSPHASASYTLMLASIETVLEKFK